MEFTKEQKIEAYKKLSEKEKDFIASNETTEIYRQIGAKNGLLLDATGKLSDIVFLALVGLIRTSDLDRAISSALGLSQEKTTALLNDVNDMIFRPFRSVLMEESQESESEEAPEPLSKEDILAEIEDPVPVSQPITVAESGPAKPQEIIENKNAVAQEFVTSKLTETVNIPAKKAAIPVPPPKSRYSADPYREPIE